MPINCSGLRYIPLQAFLSASGFKGVAFCMLVLLMQEKKHMYLLTDFKRINVSSWGQNFSLSTIVSHGLKGQCHEIFVPRFFSSINPPPQA
jgi:hypothetical protein